MGRERQRAKSAATRAKGLEAALHLFSTQGFRGTTMRQIADHAGVSMGNLYYHFPAKEDIFTELIEQYWRRILDPDLPLNRVFTSADFPDDLEDLAAAAEQLVNDFEPYILLIYVDVVEFHGEHIRTFYDGMAERFREVYGERLRQRQERGEIGRDVDPLFAVMCATRWLLHYFTVERCVGVPVHLGMDRRQATESFIQLLRHGLLPRPDGETREDAP